MNQLAHLTSRFCYSSYVKLRTELFRFCTLPVLLLYIVDVADVLCYVKRYRMAPKYHIGFAYAGKCCNSTLHWFNKWSENVELWHQDSCPQLHDIRKWRVLHANRPVYNTIKTLISSPIRWKCWSCSFKPILDNLGPMTRCIILLE